MCFSAYSCSASADNPRVCARSIGERRKMQKKKYLGFLNSFENKKNLFVAKSKQTLDKKKGGIQIERAAALRGERERGTFYTER